MSNANKNFMGFGVDPESQASEYDLMAGLAGLPDTEVAYDWMLNGGPQGQLIGDVYVPPSWSQYAADAAKTGMGAMMLNNRNNAAKELARAIANKYRQKPNTGSAFRDGQAMGKPMQDPMSLRRGAMAQTGAQSMPVDLQIPIPQALPAGNSPDGEDDIFKVSMPYGGLRY